MASVFKNLSNKVKGKKKAKNIFVEEVDSDESEDS